jgi:hypothetical protein
MVAQPQDRAAIMPAHTRLQIAARIHFFLLREVGCGIDVEGMLKRADYAGEVLSMCDKARGTVLEQLGQAFRQASAPKGTGRAEVAQPWAADTSGFGLSQPAELHQPASPRRSSSPPSGT